MQEPYHNLYWTVGDGGPQNDPRNRTQNLGELQGSIVRISVSSALAGSGYHIPAGNPFDGVGGEKAEIYAWGFRDPHRCAFDSLTDALYCGDVGQDRVEEVNVVERGNDYGWRMFEGSRCNDGYEDYLGDDCAGLDRARYVFPVFEYCHFDYNSSVEEYDACGDRVVTGLSIIGGHVYRGSRFADVLGGHYMFADHSTGSPYHLAPATGGGWTSGATIATMPEIVGFAEDHDGELDMIGYQGNIYDLPCGDLCGSEQAAASCMPQAASIPAYEEVGCFYDGSPKSLTLATAPYCDGTMSAEVLLRRRGRRLHSVRGRAGPNPVGQTVQRVAADTCGDNDKMNVDVITITATWAPTEQPAPVDSTPAPEPPPAETSFPDNYVRCYGDDKEARALTFGYTASDTMSTEPNKS
eukprot:g15605.t1